MFSLIVIVFLFKLIEEASGNSIKKYFEIWAS